MNGDASAVWVDCPMPRCRFSVEMQVPTPLTNPLGRDAATGTAMAAVAAAQAEGQRVVQVLNDHAAAKHDPDEWDRVCEATARAPGL